MGKKTVASFWAIASKDMKFLGKVHTEHLSEDNPAADVLEWFSSPVDSAVIWFCNRADAAKFIKKHVIDDGTRPVNVEVSVDSED